MAKKRAHRPEGHRAPSVSPAAPRQARRAAAPAAPTGARKRFEDLSRPALTWMRALPTFLVPALLAVALLLGLAIPAPWAGSLLVGVGLFLSWLTALSWPAVSAGSRLIRVVVDLGMLALGALKLLGRI
jgi:hypothetical protein